MPPIPERDWASVSLARGDAHVLEVTLRGPGKGNALGPDFFREMPLLFDAVDRDDTVRCVLLCGGGGEWSFGLDLPAMMGALAPHVAGSLAAGRARLLDLVGELQASCDRVARCRKPVVAAISGRCIGGGLDLAAACDVRLADRRARFSLREVKVAMVADLGSLQRLPRIIGDAATRELALTGRDIDAERALRLGLVSDLFDDEAALLAAARATAREIAQNPPLVVQGVKQVMNDCDGKSVAEGLRYVAVWNAAFVPSEDLGEALAAFMEKRPPKFRGA